MNGLGEVNAMEKQRIVYEDLVPAVKFRRVYFDASEVLFRVLMKNKFGKDFSPWVSRTLVEQLKDEGIVEFEEGGED
jgi:hypothetical protein